MGLRIDAGEPHAIGLTDADRGHPGAAATRHRRAERRTADTDADGRAAEVFTPGESWAAGRGAGRGRGPTGPVCNFLVIGSKYSYARWARENRRRPDPDTGKLGTDRLVPDRVRRDPVNHATRGGLQNGMERSLGDGRRGTQPASRRGNGGNTLPVLVYDVATIERTTV